MEGLHRFRLFQGDLIIAMTGATIGKVGIMPKLDANYYLNQRVGKFESLNDQNLIYYLFVFSKFDSFRKSILNLAGGAAQPNISGSQIESISMLIPSKTILNIFIEQVEPLFMQRTMLLEMNAKLEKARDILLPRLMNGDLAV